MLGDLHYNAASVLPPKPIFCHAEVVEAATQLWYLKISLSKMYLKLFVGADYKHEDEQYNQNATGFICSTNHVKQLWFSFKKKCRSISKEWYWKMPYFHNIIMVSSDMADLKVDMILTIGLNFLRFLNSIVHIIQVNVKSKHVSSWRVVNSSTLNWS